MSATPFTRGKKTDDVSTPEGLLHLLRTSKVPLPIDNALRLLLQQQTHVPVTSLSSPEVLIELLTILVDRTTDDWLEVRKKIAFVFSDVVSRGAIDLMEENIFHANTPADTNDDGSAMSRFRELILRLADAHGTVERCVPAADVFRTLMRVPQCLEIILSPDGLGNAGGVEALSKAQRFSKSCLGRLCRSVASDTTVLCTETWSSLTTALCTDKGLAAPLLLYHFSEISNVLLESLKGRNFVAKIHALELLAAILEDSAFLKARTKFAESPALLCALLSLTNSPSTHIRFLTFEALKVFLAKTNKPAPIRYILYINRDSLARYVEDYSTGDSVLDKRLELEKQKLLHGLTSLEPLSHEEGLLIDVE